VIHPTPARHPKSDLSDFGKKSRADPPLKGRDCFLEMDSHFKQRRS